MSIKIYKIISLFLILVMLAALPNLKSVQVAFADSLTPPSGEPSLSLEYDEKNMPCIRVTWNPPNGGQAVDGYNVYRLKINSYDQVTSSLSDYEKIKDNVMTEAFLDKDVEYGSTYHYVVTTIYDSLESEGTRLYNQGDLIRSAPVLDMVFSNESISFKGNAEIIGNTGTNSNKNNSITFNNQNSKIVGDLYYGPEANWESDNVTGSIYNLPSIRSYPLPEFPNFPEELPEGILKSAFLGTGYIINKNGVFDKIEITNNSFLSIHANDSTRVIRVKKLDIKGSLSVESGYNGKVVIYVEDSLNLDGKINYGNASDKLTIYYAGNSELTLSSNAEIFGSIYAKNANIRFSGNNTVEGSIITGGNWVNFSENADASVSLLYAPKASVNFSGNSNLEGLAVAKKMDLSGNGSIVYNVVSGSYVDQFNWGKQPSSPSENIIIVPDKLLVAPDTPSSPVLTLLRNEEQKYYVNVAWQAPTGTVLVSGYNVYRIEIADPKQITNSLSSYELIAPNIQSLSYDDTGVEEGKTYHYVITALNKTLESEGTELYFPQHIVSNVPPSLDVIFAKDSIKLEGSSKIKGDTETNSTAPGSIDFGWSTQIEGNLLLGPSADFTKVLKSARPDPKDNITGSVSNLAEPSAYPLPMFPNFPIELPQRDNFSTAEWKESGYYLIDDDGSYDKISVVSNRTLTIDLNYGTRIIRVKNLDIQQGHIELINVDENSKLILYVDDSLKMGGSSTVNNSGDHNKVYMYHLGHENINFSGSTSFFGSIYSKHANITLGASNSVTGHIITGGSSVTVSGNADANVRVIYAPNANLSLLDSGHIKGSAITKSINLSGSCTVVFSDSMDLYFFNQLKWEIINTTPSDNTVSIPLDQDPAAFELDFSSKVKTAFSDNPSGEPGDEEYEKYLNRIRFLAGDYIPIEISITPNLAVLNPIIKLDLALKDPDNDFLVNDQFDIIIEPSKTIVRKNGTHVPITNYEYPYDIIEINDAFEAGDTIEIDYTVKAIPAKNRVEYDLYKKYVVTFNIVEMLVTLETGEQIVYSPPEDYVNNFTAELIIIDPKIMR